MAEPVLVVESREHLWYLLTEASQLEHMIMCQYLYATFSLKGGTDEGLTEEQAAAVAAPGASLAASPPMCRTSFRRALSP